MPRLDRFYREAFDSNGVGRNVSGLKKTRLAWINKRGAKSDNGHARSGYVWHNKPENRKMFPGRESKQRREVLSCFPSSIQTITVGSGVAPGHARSNDLSRDYKARGLYRRSGITPCPEGNYFVTRIIATQNAAVNSIIIQCGEEGKAAANAKGDHE
jgi:hypothetical protein